jgi:signal transduction histidine kinase
LLSNSIKFSHRGTIQLSVQQKISEKGFPQILFCVRDEGIGIPEAAKQTLFQPFFQADSSVSRKYGGTGILKFRKN